MKVLSAIRYIHEKHAAINAICGLSNISFGLPNRKLLNQIFTIQTMTMGLAYTSMALLGKDQRCTGLPEDVPERASRLNILGFRSKLMMFSESPRGYKL